LIEKAVSQVHYAFLGESNGGVHHQESRPLEKSRRRPLM
jgi:hypothetical protein